MAARLSTQAKAGTAANRGKVDERKGLGARMTDPNVETKSHGNGGVMMFLCEVKISKQPEIPQGLFPWLGLGVPALVLQNG